MVPELEELRIFDSWQPAFASLAFAELPIRSAHARPGPGRESRCFFVSPGMVVDPSRSRGTRHGMDFGFLHVFLLRSSVSFCKGLFLLQPFSFQRTRFRMSINNITDHRDSRTQGSLYVRLLSRLPTAPPGSNGTQRSVRSGLGHSEHISCRTLF